MADRVLDEVLREVAALPPRTVLLVGSFLRDATGQRYITRDVVERVAAAASVPVYGVSETLVGTGIVGGRVVSFEAIGARTAELAALVLRGERPPPTSEGTSAYVFDWRQLRRWRLDGRRLPAGSAVRFRPSSPWQLARHYIAEASTLRAPLRLLVAALLAARGSPAPGRAGPGRARALRGARVRAVRGLRRRARRRGRSADRAGAPTHRGDARGGSGDPGRTGRPWRRRPRRPRVGARGHRTRP